MTASGSDSDSATMVARALTTAGFDRGVEVGSLAETVAAFRAAACVAVPLLVVSRRGAGAYAGAGWWQGVLLRASEAVPGVEVTAVLDCGERPGPALAALRAGVRDVLVDPAAEPLPQVTMARLAALATATGARLWQPPPPPLFDPERDGGRDPEAQLRDWLAASSPARGG